MHSLNDAIQFHNQLQGAPPSIDDKLISVSYYKPPNSVSNIQSNSAEAALSAAKWSQASSKAAVHTEVEIERMADYSAGLYAKTAEEKKKYLAYYREYYRNGGKVENSNNGLGNVTVNGVEYKKYRKQISLKTGQYTVP